MDKGYHVMRYLMLSAVAMFWLSCEKDQITPNESDPIVQVVTDASLQVVTPVVGFVAGTEKYGFTYNVINGVKDITTVNVYSTFTDAATEEGPGAQSNEVLLGSYPVTDPLFSVQTDTVTYEDLRAGLTLEGASLPDSDIDLKVGAGWKLRFEGILSSGETIPLVGSINIAVLSRFAGIYKYTHLEYYRINVLRDDVTDPIVGQEVFIGSVDENTFAHNEWWGPFSWPGCNFQFDVNFDDNSITVPILTECGQFGGNSLLTCASPGGLPNVPCAGSNILIPDDVTGVHKLYLTYGYFTDGSGAREFYTELEKVVD